jgi:hypothetical protein
MVDFWEVSLVRKTFTLAAAVVLFALAIATAAANAGTPPKATVTVDAQHAGLLNRPPIIVTDDRHAVLVIRAGYRVRIAQPSMIKQPPVATPSSDFTGVDRLMSMRVIGTALLGVVVAVLVVARRRIWEPRSG